MIPVDITGGGANHATVTRLCGFSFYEDASAAALIIIRKGAVDGQILFTIPLAADAGASLVFPPEYISTEDGVYVQESAGSVTGVLYQAT